jgi:hypothetical protein
MRGRDVGFFSVFFQVVGAIDFCQRNKFNLLIDFKNGPYFEREAGTNWWNYYFAENNFSFGPIDSEQVVVDDEWTQKIFSYYGRALSPKTACSYVDQVKIRRDILDKISVFLAENAEGKDLLGLHYRGTDKIHGAGKEAVKVPYEYIADEMGYYSNGCKFFIATDEQQLLDYMLHAFPGKVIHYNAIRSAGSESIHGGLAGQSMLKAGEDALIDCILLSKCQLLLRTDSNLSYACRFFNPQQKNLDLTKKYRRNIVHSTNKPTYC